MIFRLGRLIAQKGPGLILLIPFIDRMVKVDLRTVTLNIPPQEVITRDNVPCRRQRGRLLPRHRPEQGDRRGRELPARHLADLADGAALGARQGRARPAALRARAAQRRAAEDHRRVDRALGREGDRGRDQGRRDPRQMQRAIARQAEAERERRAKIINSEGEFQAAQKLTDAADIISTNPASLQLRYLQTLLEIGSQPEHDGRLPAADGRARAVPRALDTRPTAASRSRAAAAPPEPPSRARRPPPLPVLSAPEIRIDQLTGLRTILAPGRAERPDAFGPRRRRAEGRRRAAPSARAARTARRRRSSALRPGGGEPDTPGWTTRVVPNLYPALAAVAADERPATGTEPASRDAETGLRQLGRPAAAPRRGRASPTSSPRARRPAPTR